MVIPGEFKYMVSAGLRAVGSGGLSAFILLAVLAPAIGLAQTPAAGVVTGHVRGPNGVSVPGVTVQMTNLETGERKVTWSDEAGNFVLAGLPPGTYRLDASLVGFRPDVREPVPVAAGGSLKVNLALVIGSPESSALAGNQQGTPFANAGILNPQQGPGSGGDSFGGANGGGSVRFSEGAFNAGMEGVNGGGVGLEANASASATNSFLLSGSGGVQASTPMGQGGPPPFMEGMGPGSEFGGGLSMGPGGGPSMGPVGGGGAFGGGGFGGGGFGGGRGDWARQRTRINRIRGNISLRYTNSALDARPYPLNGTESPRLPAHNEQIGVSFGGPLVIPKIYNGGSKTSFFVNWNMQRGNNAFDSYSTVPTAAERLGDFSQAVMAAGALAGTVPVIYDPQSNPLGSRQPFDSNQIPSDRLNSAALGLLQYVPLPNLPGQFQNYHLQQALPNASDRAMLRIGRQLSSHDSLNGMYFFNSSRSRSVGSFPALTSDSSVRSQNLNLSEIHTTKTHFLNILTVNFNRQRSSLLNPFAFSNDVADDLGITGASADPIDWGPPQISFTNFTGLSEPIPSLSRNQTWRLADTVFWNLGKHNLFFGGELRRVEVNTLTNPDARGTFVFSGYTTSNFTADGLPVSGTGFDFADFLLGLPQTTSVRFGSAANYFRSSVVSGFFQDDWRVLSHLTLNYGLRYEYSMPFTEKYGRISDLQFGPGFTSPTVVTGQNPGSLPSSLVRSDANNVAPRIGIAYRPWLKHSVVIRAGYGIFYDGSIYSRLFPNLASQPPFAQASTLVTTPSQVLTLENGFPELGPNTISNTYAVDPDFRTPYAQTWNLSIEGQLLPNVILNVGYLRTKGTRLDLLLAPNQNLSGSEGSSAGGFVLEGTLPFTYEASNAASIYHGLVIGLRRHIRGGFSIFGNYTYSKSIDDAASVGGMGRSVVQNYLDIRAERGFSAFDVRQRLTFFYVYELPFGDGRRWLSKGGAPAHVLGDWQVSGNTAIQSGNPFTAQALGNLSNFGGSAAIFNLRADATGLPVELPAVQRSAAEFFNTAAFAAPAAGEFGNAGRNTIPGPGMVNFNFSLSRQITFSRDRGLRGDFRVEANNLFNTPNFSGLATTVNGQGFGRVTSVRGMRTITFAFRVRF